MVDTSKVTNRIQARSQAESPQIRRHRGVVQSVASDGTLSVTLDGGSTILTGVRRVEGIYAYPGDTLEIIGDDTDLLAIGKVSKTELATPPQLGSIHNNLIRNPSFEYSDPMVAAYHDASTDLQGGWNRIYWQAFNRDTGARWIHQTNAENIRSGSFSTTFVLPSTDQAVAPYYLLSSSYNGRDPAIGLDAITCAPGEHYQLSFYATRRGTAWNGGLLPCVFFHRRNGSSYTSKLGPGYAISGLSFGHMSQTDNATKIVWNFTVPKVAGSTDTYPIFMRPGIRVDGSAWGDGSFNVDDFSLIHQGEAYREVGAAGNPGFQNGWINYGGTWATCGFRLTGDGSVELKGMIKSGTGATIFTLPDGYRPNSAIMTETRTSSGSYRIDIGAEGNVSIQGGTPTWVTLSNIIFTPWAT